MRLAALLAGALVVSTAGDAKPSAPPKGRAMSEFQSSADAFRAYAASVLHASPGSLTLGPVDADVARLMTTRGLRDVEVHLVVGRATAFQADDRASGGSLRGWATPDGTAVTYDHEVGRLLDEGKRLHPDELAALLVWSMGAGHQLVDHAGAARRSPTQDGHTLRFLVQYQQAGGGGSLGPMYAYEVTLTGAGRDARLSRSHDLLGGSDLAPPGVFRVSP